MQTLTILRRGLHAVIGVVTWIAASALGLMALVIVVNVIGRYVLRRPLQGTVEMVELLLPVTVFFAVAYTEVQKGHVTMDEVVARFPRRVRAVLMGVMYFAAGIFFIIMGWKDGVLAVSYMTPAVRVTDVLSIPIAPCIFAISFGAALLGLELLLNAFAPLPSEQAPKDEVK